MSHNPLPAELECLEEVMAPVLEHFLPVCEELGLPASFANVMATVMALTLLDQKCYLAAGSVKWLCMNEEAQGEAMLQGKKPVEWVGYSYHKGKGTAAFMNAKLPDDVHVWAMDREGHIVDTSGPDMMLWFEQNHNIKWPAKTALPPVIYGQADDLKCNGWFYEKDERATGFVNHMAVFISLHPQHPQT